MKTLYLDFDGVLHPMSRAEFGPFTRLGLLEELLVARPVQIVISSSWRMHHDMDELRRLVGRLGPQVVDATGPTVLGQYARHREILEHAQWSGILNWRALDDSFFEFPEDEERLIWCDPRVGVAEKQLIVLEDWLNARAETSCLPVSAPLLR